MLCVSICGKAHDGARSLVQSDFPHEVMSLQDWAEDWMKYAAIIGTLRQALHDNVVQEM